MDLNKLNILLEKFYNGQTSEYEEEQLKKFFRKENVPKQYEQDKAYFDFLDKSTMQPKLSANFFDSLEQKLEGKPKGKTIFMLFSKKTLAIAASIAVLVFLSVFSVTYFKSEKKAQFADTYEDPREAYEATKKALLLISETMNKGTKKLKPLNKLEKNVKQVEKLKSFNKEVERLENLQKLDKGIKDFKNISKFHIYHQRVRTGA